MEKKKKHYAGKSQISFYVDPEVKEKIKAAAKANEQSVSELFQAVCDQLLGILPPEEEPVSFSVEAKKDKVVSVRLTEGEQAIICELAKKEGMSVSAYIYYFLRGYIKKDLSFTEDQLFELRRIKGNLGKIGSNLNQAVKHLQYEGATHDELLKADFLKELAQRIEQEKDLITQVIQNNISSWAK